MAPYLDVYLMLHVSYVAFQALFMAYVRMKQTPEDFDYAQRFGERLERAYLLAKSEGVTDETFADSIGVKRSALKKYLLGTSTPSLRTVVLAKRKYQISVPYGETKLGAILEKNKGKVARPTVQLRLPFSLDVAHPEKFDVQLKQVRPAKYELRISSKQISAERLNKES